jgi:hypothetical protein
MNSEKPKIFKDMKTCFEVCQWLVLERPDVLTMANQMRDSMNVSLDSPTTTVIHQPTVASNNNAEDKVLSLFLVLLISNVIIKLITSII